MTLTAAQDDLPDVAHDSAAIPSSLIDFELGRITRSKSFQQSRRHQKLLRHLVMHAVAGTTGALKEPVLAFEVFERPLATFDPARDTIVRVEARRLRQRLARYYCEEGSDAALEIRLPVGSYVPTLRRRSATDDATTRQARDLSERGEYFLRLPLSSQSLEQALARFDAALRESPDFVPALVGMGRAWINLAIGWYRVPAVASAHAAEALRRALELDPEHATAHALLGAVAHQFEYDWPSAQRNFQHAIALAPKQGFVHSAYGRHLLYAGDLDAAEQELSLARRLDPHYINTRIHMVSLRIAQGRLHAAQAELDAMRDIAPESMPAAGMAGLLSMARGDPEAATQHYRQACELAPDHPNAFASLAAAQAQAGDIAGADATIAAVRGRFGDHRLSPYVLAVVATRSSRIDDAFLWLERAIAVRDPSAMMLDIDFSFADLRDETRWAGLLASRRPVSAD